MKNSTKHYTEELPNGKKSTIILLNFKKVFLPFLTLSLIISMSFYLNDYNNNNESLLNDNNPEGSQNNSSILRPRDANEICNIFKGDWIMDPLGKPYYTNETKCVIDDRQNCMKFGRLDDEFLKWRWKPNECELPKFDAMQFLEIVRGKTLGFLGDSVGRNQMQSLVCMLASATYEAKDVSYVPDTRYRRWFYPDHNFTIEALWSPYLVKAEEADSKGFSRNSLMSLYLDEADEAWSSQIQHVDIVIVSAGHWFFRPYYLYEKRRLIGCVMCNNPNITQLSVYNAYKMAFRTTFETLINNTNFKGLVFLRTFSPSHFENGDWNNGGNCVRTKPFSKDEKKLDGYLLEMYMTQVREFKGAKKVGEKRGLNFTMMDTSKAMILRPDGHPNHYGHWPKDKAIADCVHWCMPGPVETWNEFLLQMLKREGEGINNGKILEEKS